VFFVWTRGVEEVWKRPGGREEVEHREECTTERRNNTHNPALTRQAAKSLPNDSYARSGREGRAENGVNRENTPAHRTDSSALFLPSEEAHCQLRNRASPAHTRTAEKSKKKRSRQRAHPFFSCFARVRKKCVFLARQPTDKARVHQQKGGFTVFLLGAALAVGSHTQPALLALRTLLSTVIFSQFSGHSTSNVRTQIR
jgi:hypothetical protein